MSTSGVRGRAATGLLMLATATLSACASDSPVAPVSQTSAPTFGEVQQDLQGLYLVEARSSSTQGIASAVAALGGTVRADVPQIRLVSVAGLDAKRVATLAKRSDVSAVYRDALARFVLPTRQGTPLKTPSGRARVNGVDQSSAYFYSVQWNLPKTSVPFAWNYTNGGAGQSVWVLDTGIDPNQQDLSGRVPCYTNGVTIPRFPSDATPWDHNFHGTFVSSIISSNGVGNASVAPGARLCSRKVLSEDGAGTFGDVAASIIYAADRGASVINLSWGSYFDSHSEGGRGVVNLLQRAVDFANSKGVVVVAAAGNQSLNLDTDGYSMVLVPAQLERVISVGATGPDLTGNYDALASYSNFGGETGVQLVAPGGDLPIPSNGFDQILGACSSFVCAGTNFYILAKGTSFSAAHVAAAAAVVQGALGGAPTPERVKQCLTRTSDQIGDPRVFGAGRLNVYAAAQCQ
ncbi:MAG: S8 family serine peptidase [Gemmatimonadaceae bacterium]